MKTFCDEIVKLLTDVDLYNAQDFIRWQALERFHPDNILEQWEEKIFKEG